MPKSKDIYNGLAYGKYFFDEENVLFKRFLLLNNDKGLKYDPRKSKNRPGGQFFDLS